MSRLEPAKELLAVLLTAQDQLKSFALQHLPAEKLPPFLNDIHLHNISTQQQILHDMLERESRQIKNVLIEYKKYAVGNNSPTFEGMFPEVKTSSGLRRSPKPQVRRQASKILTREEPPVTEEVRQEKELEQEQERQQEQELPQETVDAGEQNIVAQHLDDSVEHNIPAPLEITDLQIAFSDDSLLPEDELPLPPEPTKQEELEKQETLSIEQLTDRLDETPEDGDLWLRRADKWQQKGDLIAAISDYLRATDLQKENPKPWLELYNIYIQKGLGTKAAQAKQKYHRLDSAN